MGIFIFIVLVLALLASYDVTRSRKDSIFTVVFPWLEAVFVDENKKSPIKIENLSVDKEKLEKIRKDSHSVLFRKLHIAAFGFVAIVVVSSVRVAFASELSLFGVGLAKYYPKEFIGHMKKIIFYVIDRSVLWYLPFGSGLLFLQDFIYLQKKNSQSRLKSKISLLCALFMIVSGISYFFTYPFFIYPIFQQSAYEEVVTACHIALKEMNSSTPAIIESVTVYHEDIPKFSIETSKDPVCKVSVEIKSFWLLSYEEMFTVDLEIRALCKSYFPKNNYSMKITSNGRLYTINHDSELIQQNENYIYTPYDDLPTPVALSVIIVVTPYA